MKTVSSFCCVLTMLLSCLPVFSQQPNPKVLRNWELVDLPFSPPDENALLGGIKVADGVGIQPPTIKPEFDVLNSTDITFQNNGSNSISASATIFSFLTGNFKKADYKFQLTTMPNVKIYRVKNVPLVLKNSGLEAGKVIMAYAVADSFTLCSDKVSELIIQGSTTGGTPANPRSATITRKCEALSKESLESVKTGNIAAVPQKPAVDGIQIDPAKEEALKKSIAQSVVEQFNELGLQNIAATVDLQNQRVTVVKSSTPVVVAWQLVQYDSRNNSNRAVKNKFRASDEVVLSAGGRQVYKVRVGLWDTETVRVQNLSPEKPLCVYFKVTDIASNTEFVPVTYCPSTSPSEFFNTDLTGYVRPMADQWRTKKSIPLTNKATESESFLSSDSLIRPLLTFSSPVFNINSNGVTATMDVQIDEVRAKFKLVRK